MSTNTAEYRRAWHARNPGKRTEYSRRWREKHGYPYRQANKEWADAPKLERGCVDCGYNDHPAALHFDHLPGNEKVANVSAMMSRGRDAIQAEIDKCEVRCANCHNIVTAERRNG